MHNKNLYILIALGGLLILIIIMFALPRPYERHYYEKAGTNKIRYLFSDALLQHGEPSTLIIPEDGYATKAVYNGYVLYFTSTSNDAFLTGIEITNADIRFGKRSIGIGSTKNEVEKAYRRVKRSPDPGVNYVDGDIYISFEFNENNVVSKMVFFHYN